MYTNKRLQQDVISQAKSANLIDYMLTYHPDNVINWYGIRDKQHDSLVLYPDSFCRYSTMEVQDNIYYLEHYQGYRWRDAVLDLAAFSKQNLGKPGTPAFDSSYCKRKTRFFAPVATNHIEMITEYLHIERGISLETIHKLIQHKKIYPATASGFGDDYVCFANEDSQFYSLRNISSIGMPKLLFSKNPGDFWWFSSLTFEKTNDFYVCYERLVNPFPEDLPLYICEAPIDAISLYEITKKPAIYVAMAGLKYSAALNAIHEFAYYKSGDTFNHRKVIFAVDNDKAGDQFISALENKYDFISPTLKDWNLDLLQLI